VLEDLDGDGRTEVVFRSAAARTAADCKLYCFGAGGGTPKFTYQPSRSVRYGNKDYNPPFPVTRFIVTTEAGKSKAIWVVAQHHLYFPTVVQKLNSTGGVLGEYWNDGHVRLLQEGLLGGRRVIFAGGTSSDHRHAATLSVLDYEHPGGSAPATDLRDRCIGCPEVAPMAFFLFPRLAVSRALKVKPYVTEIANSRPGGDFTVGVRQGDAPGNSQAFPGSAYYTFDSSLHLLRAETGDEYQHSHNRLYLGGFLPRPYGDADERELLRVLRWDGKTLAALR
jgi:hypothetical protein